MKKINSNSTNNQIAEIGNSIVEVNKSNPITDDAFYSITYTLLSEKTAELIDTINRAGLHNGKKEMDELRDLDVRAIFYTVKAHCIRRPSEDREKALRIQEDLDRYGLEITGYSFGDESTNIRALLDDLKDPELAEERASIPDLDQLIANLEDSQGEFDVTEAKLIEGEVDRSKTKSASLVAKELKDIIDNRFCVYIEAMSLANPDKYKSYYDLLQTIINQNNRQVEEHLAALKRKKEKTKAE